jgi:UPF0176 protein
MYTVAALYKFVHIDDCSILQQALKAQCTSLDIIGTLLIATEGINGTLAGEASAMNAFLTFLRSDAWFSDIGIKYSSAEDRPFYRLKIRIKNEIVTMGVEGVSPVRTVGEYVEPQDWNELIDDPEVLVIDTRNDYESIVGSFASAIHPNTRNFREFPRWLDEQEEVQKTKKIAMFCTGGIRCEKATSYMKEQGYEHVYHLKGGILRYLDEIPKSESLWDGACFVFDQRVGVEHELKESSLGLCYACGFPVTTEARDTDEYEAGVSCPNCFGTYDADQLSRLRERQKQIVLAASRNEQHIGVARRHNDEV